MYPNGVFGANWNVPVSMQENNFVKGIIVTARKHLKTENIFTHNWTDWWTGGSPPPPDFCTRQFVLFSLVNEWVNGSSWFCWSRWLVNVNIVILIPNAGFEVKHTGSNFSKHWMWRLLSFFIRTQVNAMRQWLLLNPLRNVNRGKNKIKVNVQDRGSCNWQYIGKRTRIAGSLKLLRGYPIKGERDGPTAFCNVCLWLPVNVHIESDPLCF